MVFQWPTKYCFFDQYGEFIRTKWESEAEKLIMR